MSSSNADMEAIIKSNITMHGQDVESHKISYEFICEDAQQKEV